MKTIRIYLAAPFAWQPRMRMYAQELRALGMIVTSRWLDETAPLHTEVDSLPPKYCADTAFMDVEDIASSNIFVLFTPTEDELDNPEISKKSWARGARHYECGLAAGIRLLNAAINNFEFTFPVIIVCGPRENVFHYQDNLEHCPNWDSTLSYILRLAHENEPVAQQAD